MLIAPPCIKDSEFQSHAIKTSNIMISNVHAKQETRPYNKSQVIDNQDIKKDIHNTPILTSITINTKMYKV